MNFFNRLSNGWNISINSLKVLRENKQLLIFPLLSGLSMIVLFLSFIVAIFASSGWNLEDSEVSPSFFYSALFILYIINYFIVVFFNTALIHCSRLYFQGQKPTVGMGLEFSRSRIGVIFAWSVFAATIGILLRLLQDNLGFAGKIITGFIGIMWGVATFFVVPVIVYEQAGPVEAVKRSAQLMREKWGESLGAGFSFIIIRLLSLFLVCGSLFLIGLLFNGLVGVILAGLGLLVVIAILNAAETIFVSAVYHNVNGDPVEHFNQQMVDNLFVGK